MTNINIPEYNVKIYDFEWFFLTFEKEILDALYDIKLLDDKNLKNIDTRKTIHSVCIKNIVEKLHKSQKKIIFLVKPEIISQNAEILRHYNPSKIRRELMFLIKFLNKNKFNVFVFLKKSFVNLYGTLDMSSPDIRDFLDIHILNSNKKLFSKVSTINSLTTKLCKTIR